MPHSNTCCPGENWTFGSQGVSKDAKSGMAIFNSGENNISGKISKIYLSQKQTKDNSIY